MPKEQSATLGEDDQSIYTGTEALQKAVVLEIRHPIEAGVINGWNDVQRLWSHTCQQDLQANLSDRYVLMIDSPMNPQVNREKMIMTLFDTFNVAGAYIGNSAIMSLYASGRTTGLVLGSGYGCTWTVPISEGRPINDAIVKSKFGGTDLDHRMIKLLAKEGYNFDDTQLELVRQIKESVCYLADNLEEENDKPTDEVAKPYNLPDGGVINVLASRFQTPEALFNPRLAELELPGIDQMILTSIARSDVELQDTLRNNIVLVGFLYLLHC